jgi:hypothetical protein
VREFATWPSTDDLTLGVMRVRPDSQGVTE